MERYLSNCVKFEYQYARDFADLLGDLPAIGGRSFEMQLSNVKKGETIKLYADLGGSCDLMLAESVVTEEEAETTRRNLFYLFLKQLIGIVLNLRLTIFINGLII